MGNIIVILIIIALVGLGVLHIYRTVRYGGSCCSSGTAMDKKVRVKDRNKANYQFSYKLKVDGMVCSGCVRRVENALNSDGNLWAKADLEHKEVRVLSKKEMGREDFAQLFKELPYTLLNIE